jgi:opacity protein-like surface antigen
MKKIILIVLVMIGGLSLKAQISLGLKGGTSFSSIQIKESSYNMKSTSDNRTGFLLGGYATISMSEKLKLQPEFLYQGMGGSIDNVTFKNEYISIPVLIKYGITNNFYLEVGPQISLLVSSKAAGEDIKDAFKSSDFQVLIGASLNLTEKIGAGVRYGMGMSNISSNSFSSDLNTDIRNKAFMVMVSYKIF